MNAVLKGARLNYDQMHSSKSPTFDKITSNQQNNTTKLYIEYHSMPSSMMKDVKMKTLLIVISLMSWTCVTVADPDFGVLRMTCRHDDGISCSAEKIINLLDILIIIPL